MGLEVLGISLRNYIKNCHNTVPMLKSNIVVMLPQHYHNVVTTLVPNTEIHRNYSIVALLLHQYMNIGANVEV